MTRIDEKVSAGYPRPLLIRDQWENLNGKWKFAFDDQLAWRAPESVKWSGDIQVPFAPETPQSGINDTDFHHSCWYEREIDIPKIGDERILLHFGAVDYSTEVWVNGIRVGNHEGGYTPFSFDITDYVRPKKAATVTVRACDDPLDLSKPRGKQDWKRDPHIIWYHRTTGIWQTVWLEVVPKTYIENIQWTSYLDRMEVGMTAVVQNTDPRAHHLRLRLSLGDRTLTDDSVLLTTSTIERRVPLHLPIMDALRNEFIWSPENPALIDALIEIIDQDGNVIDSVLSYAALRSVKLRVGQFLLNDRPCQLRLVLDQGYWPESGLTAPDNDALRRDVELAKEMGFNGVRKHQKIEDPRYMYWCDRLGLMMWAEMPPAYRFDSKAIQRTINEWVSALEICRNHPSIVTWVTFNESTGVLNLPGQPAQRHYVESMALLSTLR